MAKWQLVGAGGIAAGLAACFTVARVTAVQIVQFDRIPSFRGSAVSAAVADVTGEARREHDDTGRDFWESVISRIGRLTPTDRQAVMEGALRHGGPVYERREVGVDEFLENLRSGRYTELSGRSVVALSSRVSVSGRSETLQLPFIDFSLPASDPNDTLMLEVLTVLGAEGCLFHSGRSYHYFGAVALTDREWVSQLANAQLLAPITDRRWVAHQFLDGESSLRVSTDAERHVVPHRLVASSVPLDSETRPRR